MTTEEFTKIINSIHGMTIDELIEIKDTVNSLLSQSTHEQLLRE